jgi:AcrR family transcriptional regulator
MTSMARARVIPKPARVRRTPEEARERILAAARVVLAEKGPDAAGLKDIAAAAGVSHALVSHYFGTYDALVEAVMAAHQAEIRAELLARMAASPDDGPAEWIDHVFSAIAHPLYGRLAAWSVLSGRIDSESFFARREQGLRLVVDVIAARLGGGIGIERERIERVVLVVLTSVLGYSFGRTVLWGALGHEATAARDAAFRKEIALLLTPLFEEAMKRSASAKAATEAPTKRKAR